MTATPAIRRTEAPTASGTRNEQGGWLLAAPLLLFTACMFLYPATTVIRTSLARSNDVDAGGFTFSHYISFFSDELYLKALTNTLLIAVLTTVITGAIGLLYAYQLTVRPGLRQLQLALLLTPLLVNGVVRIFGLQLGLISVDDLLMRADLIDSPLGLNYSLAGIVIALVMFQFPFMAMAVYASLSRLDTTLVEAARTLGADRLSVLVRVVFPLAVPGLVAGGVLTFAAAAGTFIVPAMMGGGRVNTVPQMVYTSLSQSQLWATASAFAVILVVVLVIPIMLGTHFGGRDTSGAR
ncbi:ABC transporter permease [Dactylosporangium sp. AC04546]|uniref:ABC transporter permease n=1 Tax=Dactylosporangium sp. AC04546 TaxID=2862460 RepID=UPI001EDF3B51|nr:ABC transporter permease [Dactylosporangium sp. AC04546]WVK80706.1 ABC transporter permease [Dactylosporangium sp. AC04546]